MTTDAPSADEATPTDATARTDEPRTDAPTDTDAQAVPDGGTDTDAQAVPDGGTDTDAQAVPDGETDTDAQAVPDGETDTDAQAVPDGETDTDAKADPDDAVSVPALEDHLGQARLRTHIADAAIELIRTGDTLTPDGAAVAAAADVDPDLLQRQFPTWESLVAVAVMHWHESRIAPLLAAADGSGAVAFLEHLVQANLDDPRMMRLLVSTLTAGADTANPAAPFYRNQYAAFHRTVRRLFEQDVVAGREPATIDPRHAAVELLAVYEGLQLQGLLRGELDVLAAFRMLTDQLRRGWAAGAATEAPDGVYEL